MRAKALALLRSRPWLLFSAFFIVGLLWALYVVWSELSFQECIDKYRNDEFAGQLQKDAPKPPYSFVFYARIVTACSSQWAGENEAAITAFATIVIAFFTLTLWRSTHSLWREAQDAGRIAKTAADAAKKSADASLLALRPWVSCNVDVTGPLIFKENGDALFHFRFVVKNVGKTPAMSVQLFFPKMNLSAPGFEYSIGKLQRLAEGSRGLPVTGGTIAVPGNMPINNPTGTLLFPDESFIDKRILPISGVDLVKSCKDIHPATHFWPELIVLVTYVYQLASVRADTGFVYELRKTDGTPFEIGENVGASEIEIQPHSMWGGFAT